MLRLNISNLNPDLKRAISDLSTALDFELSNDGIEVRVASGDTNSCMLSSGQYNVIYKDYSYIFRGIKNLIQNGNGDFSVVETCAFDNMGIMVDCSRNAVLTVDGAKKLIRILAASGYNRLMLYTEDTYEVQNEPFFGYLRGRYSKDELKQIDVYASLFGIELVPCIQTLAHFTALVRWRQYSSFTDIHDILLVGDDRTYQLIDNIFATLAECFKSRNINIGMDEAWALGLGRYQEKHGQTNRFDIMLTHLERVNEIANKYGFKCSMWSDMFFRLAFGGNYYVSGDGIPADVFDKVPKNIELIYWDYYSNDEKKYSDMMKAHSKFPNDIAFAGGIWAWNGFAPHNAFSISGNTKAIKACKKNGIKNAFFTVWGDNGAESSVFKVLPAIISAAENAYSNTKISIIKKSFAAITGTNYNSFMLVDLPNSLPKAELHHNNPSKYLLYNDLFLGFLDTTICEGGGREYSIFSKQLNKCCKDKRWGYLFKHLKRLCDVLALKYDLGIVTRKLYKAGDKQGLIDLVNSRYKPLIRKLDEFYYEFLDYWNTDNKPHGFDVQDIRLGGLIQRVKHCKEVLLSFANGKLPLIPELEEQLIDYFTGSPEHTKSFLCWNEYVPTSTINLL